MDARKALALLLFTVACGSTGESMMGPDPTACALGLTVCPNAPVAATLSAVRPAVGPSTGGITLTIDGTNFQSGALVSIGGIATTQVAVVSPLRLTAVLPARPGVFGAVPITVQNPGAVATSRDDLFAYFIGQIEFPMPRYNTGLAPYRVAVGDVKEN